ncbi:MAG TPA: hypothetical protein VD908_07820 [Cytophagales bacterium]|nr:hypothetical protein [Cytophagales bacterium]
MNIQKISALKAPALIQGLRSQVKDLRKEKHRLELKDNAMKRIHYRLRKDLLLYDSEKAVVALEDRILYHNIIDESKELGERIRLGVDYHMEMEQTKKRKDEKKQALRKLFDFRKKTPLETLEAEAQKIINS